MYLQMIIVAQIRVGKLTKADKATIWQCKIDGKTDRKPGSGRKRKTSLSDDAAIALYVKRNRDCTLTDLQKDLQLKHVCCTTLGKRIFEQTGFSSHLTIKKPMISESNRKIRLNWAKEHLHWTEEDWRSVL